MTKTVAQDWDYTADEYIQHKEGRVLQETVCIYIFAILNQRTGRIPSQQKDKHYIYLYSYFSVSETQCSR